MILDTEKINGLERRYRATFINSLSGFRQAVLVGTRSAEGHANLAIFNSLLHIGANPPLYAILFRPDTVRRDTLNNILETGEYTFNYITGSDFEKAHQTSAKYSHGISEFEAVGFSEEYADGWSAPFVKEAVIKIAMKFEERIDIKINGTILIVGSIQRVELDDSLVGSDGFVALEQANVLACAGLDAYYTADFKGRLTYARPDEWPTLL
jgi:flavin reductase (DIM6/NTAB) family NADH-FMN oxidoreductase RutF